MYLAQFKRYSSTLLNKCIIGVTLNVDLSRSLIFLELICGHKFLVKISERYLHYLWKYNMLKLWKRPYIYNGVFGCHGNTCYIIFYQWFVFARYIVQVQSMCVRILRSIGTKLTNLENMPKPYVLSDITWCENGTSYVMAARIVLIGIFY